MVCVESADGPAVDAFLGDNLAASRFASIERERSSGFADAYSALEVVHVDGLFGTAQTAPSAMSAATAAAMPSCAVIPPSSSAACSAVSPAIAAPVRALR
jgi:hypothetical protein